jgi:single-strand DNA-binding protein
VAIEGRLDWREWEAKDGGGKRQAVQIIANTVQFLGSRDGGGAPNGNGGQQQAPPQQQPYNPQHSDVPADESDFGPVSTGGQEDDIPF